MIWLFIISYLIGSVPFGLILARLCGYGDLRSMGSGNIGATNVLRNCSKKLAILTLLLDGGKGALPILLFIDHGVHDPAGPDHVSYILALIYGFGAVLGHNFPIWLKFKGGKGVATTLGALLAAVPWAGLATCLTWLAMAFMFRYSSLSALIASLVAPLVTFFVYGDTPAVICAFLTVLLWIRHKDNIRRLLKGEEEKIGEKKENV